MTILFWKRELTFGEDQNMKAGIASARNFPLGIGATSCGQARLAAGYSRVMLDSVIKTSGSHRPIASRSRNGFGKRVRAPNMQKLGFSSERVVVQKLNPVRVPHCAAGLFQDELSGSGIPFYRWAGTRIDIRHSFCHNAKLDRAARPKELAFTKLLQAGLCIARTPEPTTNGANQRRRIRGQSSRSLVAPISVHANAERLLLCHQP
jgi:hypothetical protein